uniref:CCHC-type domain-containing protein n=1 Tax=Lactuca sativa TaxID=4236 RepID=A0A9R1WWJ0_LACSA|nr:hypothetical protein LSAT_V11C800396200 [Lactuca sativa]
MRYFQFQGEELRLTASHIPYGLYAMIKGHLTTTMEKETNARVKYANIAQEIWEDLREKLLSTTRQDGVSISAYYTKLWGIGNEISSLFSMPRCYCAGCRCGISKKLGELKDKERLYEFFIGFGSDFSTIITQILVMKLIPTFGEAYHLVVEDEQQRVVSTRKKLNTETVAFQAFMRRDGATGGQNIIGSNNGKITTIVERCGFCGKDGHHRDGCFKRIGYPKWLPGKGKTRPDQKVQRARPR